MTPLIAREGWLHIAMAVLAAALVQYFAGGWWALPLWLFAVFNLQFFRDPPRVIPAEPLAVVSPADGKVVFVGEVRDPYLDREAIKISIFMNVFNVHSNWSPVEGKVMERWYHPGSFINAVLDKASEENERNAIWVRTDEGDDVVTVQVAGLIARRILCYAQPGERLGHGERYGFIRFGSRLDVYVPSNSRVTATLGTSIRAGSDIVAYLVH
jgi:phosphatidylserine decarboxylase